jgi:hypothetical protein
MASDNGMIPLNELPAEKPNSLLDEAPIDSWTCTIGPLNSTQPFSPLSKVTGSLEMTGPSSPLPVMSRLGPLGSLTPARPVSPQSVRNETQKSARLGSPLSLARVQPCISSGSLEMDLLPAVSHHSGQPEMQEPGLVSPLPTVSPTHGIRVAVNLGTPTPSHPTIQPSISKLKVYSRRKNTTPL